MVDKFDLLDSLIRQYLSVKIEEEGIIARKNELADKIKDLLEKEPGGRYITEGGTRATLVEKTNFKYNDETAIMNYLTMKGLKDVYMIKKIDTTKFNSELKVKGALFEDVKAYITETKQKSLTITEGK